MLEEAASRHRSGDVQSHNVQNRGSDVGKDATIGIQLQIPLTKVNQGHGLGSVLGVWLVVFVVAHLLSIAVIRCDQTFATRSKQRCFDVAQALIEGFHRCHGGIKLTGVAHHVTVGKVDDDKVVVTRLDGRD